MNPYKKYVWLIRILITSLFAVIAVLIVLPFIMYITKVPSAVVVSPGGVVESLPSGMQWIVQHEKLVKDQSGKSDLIYMGDAKDLEASIRHSVDHNQVVFDMLFSQLETKSYASKMLEDMLHIQYTGYVGKTFVDLSDKNDVPSYLIDQYEAQEGMDWDFVGEGLVLFSKDKIMVLVDDLDYDGPLLLNDGRHEMPYYGYFEITTSNQLPLAWLDLKIRSNGQDKLSELGIETKIPALYKLETSLYQGVYLPLDMSKRKVDVPFQYSFITSIMKNKGIYSLYNDEQAYWQWYVPLMQSLMATDNNIAFNTPKAQTEPTFIVKDQQIFRRGKEGSFEPFFIKGVNLGAALPSKTFTEFPQDKALYLDWLEQMKTLNFNAIRLYTLLPPSFYEALFEFNLDREEPIYLLQEIWPEENPLEGNYLDATYNVTYEEEIRMAVAAIHGDINIPLRSFRAYGLYAYDVSPYTLAYLVGREMEPEEVKETNALNVGVAFKGEYLYTEPQASPTEAWLASSCDYALKLSFEHYGQKPLVAIVSWPTLDPLNHDSEWNASGDKSLQYNDSITVDIGHIGINEERVAGFFGAYHIYPNYPDFMNLDPRYDAYTDDEGRFRYGGYLKDFMAQHTRYPALVAEYGIATSMYTAHYTPDGLNHGGLSEQQQADMIIRMTKAIKKEAYSGAVIFEWMDEWAKKTWSTEPYMIPYERHVLWHNVMDPEQNYGLLAYESSDPLYSVAWADDSAAEGLKSIRVGQNEAYLFIDLELSDFTEVNEPINLALSTSSEQAGEDQWEFVISVGETAEILVNPGYNWITGHYSAVKAELSQYERLMQLTNKENTTESGIYTESLSQDLSILRKGSFGVPQNHIRIQNNHVTLRLPYGLLGISDPSSKRILSDSLQKIPVTQNSILTKENDKIKYELTINNQNVRFEQVLSQWEMPIYSSRLKASVLKIATYFEMLGNQ